MDEERPKDDESPTGSESVSDESTRDDSSSDEPGRLPSHVAGTLCYILSFASGVVFLLLEEDKFVRFHAFQSILLGAVVIILQIGIEILSWVPPLGWFVGGVLRTVVGFGWILLTIFLMAKAYSGERYQLPYIGPRAAKLTTPY